MCDRLRTKFAGWQRGGAKHAAGAKLPPETPAISFVLPHALRIPEADVRGRVDRLRDVDVVINSPLAAPTADGQANVRGRVDRLRDVDEARTPTCTTSPESFTTRGKRRAPGIALSMSA